MFRFYGAAVLCALLIAATPVARAQTQPTPPGWTQQDMNRLVESVSDAVVRKLGEKAVPATGKPAEAPKGGSPAAPVADAAQPDAAPTATAETMRKLASRLHDIAGSLFSLSRHVGNLPAQLDNTATGGLSFSGFVLRLLLVAALALFAEWLVRFATAPFMARFIHNPEPPPSFPRWLGISAIEALAIAALWLVGHAVFVALFPLPGEQTGSARVVLLAIAGWRINLAVLRCWLRPNLEAGRLAPINNAEAATIMRITAICGGIAAASRAFTGILVTTGATRDEIVLNQFLSAPIVIGGFIIGVLAVRGPMAHWLDELMALGSRDSWDAVIARNWYIGGILFYLALGAAAYHGGLSGRTDLPNSLNDLHSLIVGWLLIETTLYCIHKRRKQAKLAAGNPEPQVADIGWRALNVLARIALAIYLIRIIATEILNLVPMDAWAGYGAQLAGTGIIIFAAWLAWHALDFYFDKVAGPEHGIALPGSTEAEDEKIEGTSRLKTLAPVLRRVGAVVLIGLTILLVLSQLGVNITPILAGASIFGLAVSFGSQSLVRDIVSGIFFLADDAFRVGEYIDIGKAKGTVESFTLRSIRLRHQSGQVHTIPFGQLGQITNFSRDYATVKFNLRFARDTDVETLRKASKKIGLELMEDPELKDDFLLPLKLQGIADIQDNALIARFKFTVRPGRPSYIQRLAVKRMLQSFREKGIEFASNTVQVRSFDGTPVPTDMAGAATRMNQQPAIASGA